MKFTRNYAIEVSARLGHLTLGRLSEETLEKTMNNLYVLQKIKEDFELLKKELFKRLYGDIDTMPEDERKRLNDFFVALNAAQKANGSEEVEKALKEKYPDLCKLRQKEIGVLISLLDKEVEADIEKIDKESFVKGIMLSNKDVKIDDLIFWFTPMFVETREETDLSELDELLKD